MTENPLVRRTRSFGAGVVAVLLGAAVLLGGPAAGPAHACSCMATTDEEAFARADAVFRGQVTGYQPPAPDGEFLSSTDPAIWTFAVSEVYKGDVAPSQQIISAFSGASCGLEIPHQGEFIVFAGRRGLDGQVSGDQYFANLCGGTRSTAAGPLAVAQVPPSVPVTTEPAPPTTVAPPATTIVPTTEPAPPPADLKPATVGIDAQPVSPPTAGPQDETVAAAPISDDREGNGSIGLVALAAILVLLAVAGFGLRGWARLRR